MAAAAKKKTGQKGAEGKLATCSRGHQFAKSKDMPVCPQCWPGYYKKKVT